MDMTPRAGHCRLDPISARGGCIVRGHDHTQPQLTFTSSQVHVVVACRSAVFDVREPGAALTALDLQRGARGRLFGEPPLLVGRTPWAIQDQLGTTQRLVARGAPARDEERNPDGRPNAQRLDICAVWGRASIGLAAGKWPLAIAFALSALPISFIVRGGSNS